ncbi:hypothetical protein MRA01_60550 [Methylobacterium radiotolerans]|nr:hypothetical protein MRA01_60550 [Methylobacterium radiotolerans]
MWWMTDYEAQRRPKPTTAEEEQPSPMIGCASPGCNARASVVCAETKVPYCVRHRGLAQGWAAAVIS